MKYENAKDILPKHLLEEVQKYASGKILYVPSKESPRGWGEASGYRSKLEKRNQMIQNMYSNGKSVFEIAEEFFLSPETIKKIVYGKKSSVPMFSQSVSSAEQYADAGMAEEWIRNFMEMHKLPKIDYANCFVMGVVRIPLRLIYMEESVNSSISIKSIGEPLVVFFDGKIFTVPYQSEQLKQLKEEKRNAYAAFVVTDNKDYTSFWNHYGKYFQKVGI